MEKLLSRKGLLRIVLLLALLTAMALAINQRDALTVVALQERLDVLGNWAPAVFILVYVAVTVLCLPGAVMTIAGGLLFGPWLGALYNLSGATLGAGLAFLVARYLASEWGATGPFGQRIGAGGLVCSGAGNRGRRPKGEAALIRQRPGRAQALADPAEHPAHPGRDKVEGFLEVYPAIFMVLGSTELGRDAKLNLDLSRLGEIVARHFALGIRPGLDVAAAPMKAQLCDTGFFRDFAPGSRQRLLITLHLALWKVPVLKGSQQQKAPMPLCLPHHRHTRGEHPDLTVPVPASPGLTGLGRTHGCGR